MPPPLHFVDTEEPGIARRQLRGHWAYFSADGQRIVEREEIDRLNAIGLPPAYTDAWFSPDSRAHILATGIDAVGRKQYRYHPEFVAERDSQKFESCAAFGADLPRLRARVEQDLARRGLSAERAIASIVRLLDSGRIRVGNEQYVQANGSFGATTLRMRHARLGSDRLTLRFRAKSGKLCTFSVSDRGLVRFVKQMQDLPGQHLFQYLGEGGEPVPISSSDVNAYIRETMGGDFTAKHFRTWAASALAFEWLVESHRRGGKGTLRDMLAHVAEHLGNTPAIARKSYIHPALIACARSGEGLDLGAGLPRRTRWLSRYERGLAAFLARC